MDITLTDTISLLEVIWTLVCVCGLTVNLLGLADARGDLRYLQEQHLNGFRAVIASGNVRHEANRCLVQGSLGLAGALAMILPNGPVHWPANVTEYIGLAIRLLFIVAAVTMSFNSVADREDRKRLIRIRRGDNPYSNQEHP